jgi:hypothetical protein
MKAAKEAGSMRGRRNPQITMLAYIDLEERVPSAHPPRTIKRPTDTVFTKNRERLLQHEVGQQL